ncbi:TPA: hypothetical protein ACU8BE_002215 [Neisseria subflava]
MAGMSNTSVKKNPLEQMKETRCIYIPGQPIKNVTPGCDYKIVLGSVREIVFNFNLKSTKEVAIEIEKLPLYSKDVRYFGVYDLQTKKLISEKFTVKSGVSYRVQVSRFFAATFIAKVNGKVVGRYTPKLLDSKNYGREAALWIEPIYIGFSEVGSQTPLAQVVQQHNTNSQRWLDSLPQFNNSTTLTPPYSTQSVSKNFAGVCTVPAKEHAVVLLYKPNKTGRVSWKDVFNQREMTVAQMKGWLNEEDFDELVRVVASFGTPEYASVLNGAGFVITNFHWKQALDRMIQIKWIRGYVAISFKGTPAPFNFTYAGLAHEKTKGMAGGIHIRKPGSKKSKPKSKPKRVMLQAGAKKAGEAVVKTAKQIRGLAAVGLVIDFFGDYNAVMVDEKGSREVGELLGRVGISIFAAGVGIAVSNIGLAASMTLMAMFGFTLPAAVVLLIGLAVVMGVGYVVADQSSKLKDKIWGS